MIQGGCPNGNGMGGPGYSIKGEFNQNRFQNDLKHEPGVISMARSMHPDSAGSQFFIMHRNAPHLDGQYAAFGKVIEGMDEVNRIAEVQTGYGDKPVSPEIIKEMTVETFGVDYPEPKKCNFCRLATHKQAAALFNRRTACFFTTRSFVSFDSKFLRSLTSFPEISHRTADTCVLC